MGANTVYLEYVEFASGGVNVGVSAGTSLGTFEPMGPATPL